MAKNIMSTGILQYNRRWKYPNDTGEIWARNSQWLPNVELKNDMSMSNSIFTLSLISIVLLSQASKCDSTITWDRLW